MLTVAVGVALAAIIALVGWLANQTYLSLDAKARNAVTMVGIIDTKLDRIGEDMNRYDVRISVLEAHVFGDRRLSDRRRKAVPE